MVFSSELITTRSTLVLVPQANTTLPTNPEELVGGPETRWEIHQILSRSSVLYTFQPSYPGVPY